MQKKIFKLIFNSYNRKYKNIVYKKKDLEKIINYKFKIFKDINRNKLKINQNFTLKKRRSQILNLFINFLKKKKTNKVLEKIFVYYKKYSSQLFLRNQYDNNNNKITKKKAYIETYIILGNLIMFLKKINNLQKLNVLLKINDYSIMNIKKIQRQYFFLFKKNLLNEFILINKILYKK